ncbi:MAG: glycosyltransferase family 2 protein [Ignavibacteriales bacterium]|nr:glycosyltransferase family 2 protein [Ignavibacteriales bacterium]
MPSLDIVIVNWNAGNYLRPCLQSIEESHLAGCEVRRVVVIDNASTDGSTQGLSDLKLPITVLHNNENRGFASACNQGAEKSAADHLLFLNPDTRLSKNSLAAAVSCMSSPEQQKTGILGIQLIDDDGTISRSCARFPTAGRFLSMMFGLDRLFPGAFRSHFMTEWDHRESREVDQVIGAFFMVRTALFKALHGFDERYFVFFEEVDFALRARRVGLRSYYLATAPAYHKGGGTTDQIRATRMFYSLRSRILFFYKNFDGMTATMVAVATLFIEPITRILFAILKGSGETISETVKGYARLWGALPLLMVGRGRKSA